MKQKYIFILIAAFGLYKFFSSKSMTCSGIDFNYIEHSTRKSSSNLPLLIVLHGSGDSEKGWLSFVEEINFPIRAILFRGQYKRSPGYDFFPVHTSSHEEYYKKALETSQALNVCVAELVLRYPSNIKPMVFGFSRGASVALDMGLSAPYLYSGIFSASPGLTKPVKPEYLEDSETKFFIYHGEVDSVAPYNSALRFHEKIKKAKGISEFRSFKHGHMMTSFEERKIRSDMLSIIE